MPPAPTSTPPPALISAPAPPPLVPVSSLPPPLLHVLPPAAPLHAGLQHLTLTFGKPEHSKALTWCFYRVLDHKEIEIKKFHNLRTSMVPWSSTNFSLVKSKSFRVENRSTGSPDLDEAKVKFPTEVIGQSTVVVVDSQVGRTHLQVERKVKQTKTHLPHFLVTF